jgi:hypothetical protein
MKDYLNIDPVPMDEPCTQIDEGIQPQIEEAKRMVHLLRKRFPNCNKINYQITRNPHDFGTYIDIRILFDEDDEVSESQAFFVEANLPFKWTDEEILEWIPDEPTI